LAVIFMQATNAESTLGPPASRGWIGRSATDLGNAVRLLYGIA
jgi:hypothetical protein